MQTIRELKLKYKAKNVGPNKMLRFLWIAAEAVLGIVFVVFASRRGMIPDDMIIPFFFFVAFIYPICRVLYLLFFVRSAVTLDERYLIADSNGIRFKDDAYTIMQEVFLPWSGITEITFEDIASDKGTAAAALAVVSLIALGPEINVSLTLETIASVKSELGLEWERLTFRLLEFETPPTVEQFITTLQSFKQHATVVNG